MPGSAEWMCDLCGSTLGKKERAAHKKLYHPKCTLCHERFERQEGLRRHQTEAVHCFCLECNIFFSNPREHNLHARTAKHGAQYSCCDCGHDYPTAGYLNKHCCKCDMVYRSTERLKRHFRSCPSHRPRLHATRVEPQASLQHKCGKCNDRFATKKALKKHKRTHKAPRIIPCPTRALCSKKFPTPSALLSHLESGRCPSGMTRARLNGMVIAHDHQGQIVDHTAIENIDSMGPDRAAIAGPEQLAETRLELCESEDSFDRPAILTPSVSEASDDWMQAHMDRVPETRVVRSTQDTSGIINSNNAGNNSNREGNEVEYRPRACPLCPNRPAFRSAAAFQAHVNSAAHAPHLFHCPLLLAQELASDKKPVRIKSFSTLSGLAQHLEAGACRGGLVSFRQTIKYVESQLSLLGFGHIRLLVD